MFGILCIFHILCKLIQPLAAIPIKPSVCVYVGKGELQQVHLLRRNELYVWP